MQLTPEHQRLLRNDDRDWDDPEVMERIELDKDHCNCDMDDPCLNEKCMAQREKDMKYWASYWTPTMIEAYRPEYDPNFDHRDCGLMCPHERKY